MFSTLKTLKSNLGNSVKSLVIEFVLTTLEFAYSNLVSMTFLIAKLLTSCLCLVISVCSFIQSLF